MILDSSEENSENELSDNSVDKANLATKFKINNKRVKKIMKTSYFKNNKSVEDQSLNFDVENGINKNKVHYFTNKQIIINQIFSSMNKLYFYRKMQN